MNRWLVSVAVCLSVSAALCALPARAGRDVTVSLEVGGVERTAYLHLPADRDSGHIYPLVIGFHGGLGNAEGYIKSSRLFEKGEAAGFVVICPEGTSVIGNHRVWNSGPEYARASHNSDDVAFTRALIDAASAHAAIDRKRIYATGFSNGGQMSYRLALELSDAIATIAPMSGGLSAGGEFPSRPVPVMHFHGLADTVYPLEGGLGPHSIGRTPHVPIAGVISEWIAIDHAASKPLVIAHDGWQEQVHAGPVPVTLVLVEDLGHQIAGGMDDHLPDQPLSAKPDAISMALSFFLAHPMP